MIDTKEYPDEAEIDILEQISGVEKTVSTFKKQLHNWLESKLSNYRREFGDRKHIFYVDTQVWYDYEVPTKIKAIK